MIGQLEEPAPLSDRDAIEARALRRRESTAAFLFGEQGLEDANRPTFRGLLLGLAVALLITLVVGIVGLVQGSHRQQPSSPPAPATDTTWPMPT